MKFKEYANSFQAIARLELESIKLLTEYLGHPENDLKFIHVAGTNGKGSVCAFLQEIFTSAGYKCGKYISPNMVSVCERISVDGTEISENELNDILKNIAIEYHTTIDDVRTEMLIAIKEAQQSTDPAVQARWNAIPRTGEELSLEEFIAYCSTH